MNQHITAVTAMSETPNIWDRVDENIRILESCDRHNFSVQLDHPNIFRMRWKCDRCGGVVDRMAKFWYERGLEHGAVVPQ